MNWKRRFTGIKIGDTVKCIDNPNKQYPLCDGWALGRMFVVANIDVYEGHKVMFPRTGNGVFSESLVKV